MYIKPRKQIYAKYSHRTPKPKKEGAEFGRGKKEFVMCQDCGNVYFDKSWKHGFSDEKSKHLKEERRIKFSICSACQMIKDKKFEGGVILENAPPEFKKDILRTIANMAKQAYERDPQDRVWKIEDKGRIIEVLTTENQLAVRIAKKISQTFQGKLEIKHSSEEDVTRVRVVWEKD